MSFGEIFIILVPIFFVILLVAFWLDGSTSKRHRLSWMIVLVGALFWGLVLPIAVIERSRKMFKHKSLASRQVHLS